MRFEQKNNNKKKNRKSEQDSPKNHAKVGLSA